MSRPFAARDLEDAPENAAERSPLRVSAQAAPESTAPPDLVSPLPDECPVQDKPAEERMPRWRMALLLASSALLSGIAVVIWNRRTLQHMREPQPAPPAEPENVDRDFI